ncbi:MAG: acetyl-CoA carboxylase, carboxyltransferase subunit beta [Lachnospiraceae bacterium]|nr:acetyl-CoA carboxylase, carboxyltransferase subunit beta [Lachnospiraceae bacterium]
MESLLNTISLSFVSKNVIEEEIEKKDGEPVFVTCKKCKRRSLKRNWKDNYYVCPNCGKYRSISAQYRMSLIFDPGSYKEINAHMKANDPMKFPEYAQKLEKQKNDTGLEEAAVTAVGKIGGHKTTVVVLDSRFFMGSMSTVVGEKVTRAVEYATKKKTPLIIFSASGGARMQEGIYSLMQMAKTSAAIEEFHATGGLYISFLTHPTTGGVTASFATLGDITLAEPGALIGFAGPRVIEQTINKKLPKGFQKSEYLEAHGFVDKIVPRNEMRDTLIQLLDLHQK